MNALEALCRAGEGPHALATVVATEGSSPAEPAMKMVVGEKGRLAGTVGGGRVEAAVEAKAREVLASGRPEIVSFELDDDLADEGGMICGGTVRILVERVDDSGWAATALRAQNVEGRRAVVLARIGEAVERSCLVGDDATPYVGQEQPRLEDDLFIEPFVRPRCIIIGAGHVGRAVARIAKVAGFLVAIVEDRPDAAARAEELAEICIHSDLEPGFAGLGPGPDDFVVVMTRGHGLDLRCVRAALTSPARYVGMLASRKKSATIREALTKEGVDVERLHAPVGLDLGALSAGEIATSVVAQLVKVRRLGRGDR